MYKNNLHDGIVLMLKGWRATLTNMKFVILWGVLSSVFTSILLLCSGWILSNIENPLAFYVSNSIVYNIIMAPIFLMAYVMTLLYQYKDRENASSLFKKSLKDFYLWCATPILLFVVSGLSMIFIANTALFYSLISMGFAYLFFTGIAPFYMVKSSYSVAEANRESFGNIKSHIMAFLPTCIINGAILLGLFKLLDWSISITSIHSNKTAMVLVIGVSLAKPLLYALPLFSVLNAISDFKKANDSPVKHEEYVEVGETY